MRFGGPVFEKYSDPEGWLKALGSKSYTAAYCPLDLEAKEGEAGDYSKAAREADVVIAEVGAWCNPISPDEQERKDGLEKCRQALSLAERISARCCVNVAGSRGTQWAGPHPDNLTDDTFDLIVESVRDIIDAVNPSSTFYTLETMPWMYPDSTESYVRLVKAVDRAQFAVHFDPVNLICSPQRYYGNAALIRDFIAQLGPHIKSCHAKDILLSGKLTTHLDEVRPGLGGLDYKVLLAELDKLDPGVPLMLEHMASEQEYDQAAAYIRSAAGEAGVTLR